MSDSGEEQVVHISVPMIPLKLECYGNNGNEEQLTFRPSASLQQRWEASYYDVRNLLSLLQWPQVYATSLS